MQSKKKSWVNILNLQEMIMQGRSQNICMKLSDKSKFFNASFSLYLFVLVKLICFDLFPCSDRFDVLVWHRFDYVWCCINFPAYRMLISALITFDYGSMLSIWNEPVVHLFRIIYIWHLRMGCFCGPTLSASAQPQLGFYIIEKNDVKKAAKTLLIC